MASDPLYGRCKARRRPNAAHCAWGDNRARWDGRGDYGGLRPADLETSCCAQRRRPHGGRAPRSSTALTAAVERAPRPDGNRPRRRDHPAAGRRGNSRARGVAEPTPQVRNDAGRGQPRRAASQEHPRPPPATPTPPSRTNPNTAAAGRGLRRSELPVVGPAPRRRSWLRSSEMAPPVGLPAGTRAHPAARASRKRPGARTGSTDAPGQPQRPPHAGSTDALGVNSTHHTPAARTPWSSTAPTTYQQHGRPGRQQRPPHTSSTDALVVNSARHTPAAQTPWSSTAPATRRQHGRPGRQQHPPHTSSTDAPGVNSVRHGRRRRALRQEQPRQPRTGSSPGHGGRGAAAVVGAAGGRTRPGGGGVSAAPRRWRRRPPRG